MNQYGIVIVSRVSAIAEGIKQLIEQVATHVPITIAGGIEDNGVGTSMEHGLQLVQLIVLSLLR